MGCVSSYGSNGKSRNVSCSKPYTATSALGNERYINGYQRAPLTIFIWRYVNEVSLTFSRLNILQRKRRLKLRFETSVDGGANFRLQHVNWNGRNLLRTRMEGLKMLVDQSAYDARFEIHHGNLLNPFTISTQAAHLQAKLVVKKNLAIYMQVRVKHMRGSSKLRCTCVILL